MNPNSKRERSWSAQSLRFVFTGARGSAAARSRFDPSNPKRAHPPIPPPRASAHASPAWGSRSVRASGSRSRFETVASGP